MAQSGVPRGFPAAAAHGMRAVEACSVASARSPSATSGTQRRAAAYWSVMQDAALEPGMGLPEARLAGTTSKVDEESVR